MEMRLKIQSLLKEVRGEIKLISEEIDLLKKENSVSRHYAGQSLALQWVEKRLVQILAEEEGK